MAPRRRTALVAGAAVVAVAVVVTLVLVLRGDSPETVAEDYLRATWDGDPETQCEIATQEWRRVLYGAVPYNSCAEFAGAAAEDRERRAWDDYRDDTDLTITVEPFSTTGDKARVSYLVELDYTGEDPAGFEDLLQSSRDRGTIELVELDGEWRVAGVDAG